MLIIRKGIVNNPIATVSMNKTLSNPYYLFSFQHIASKERVSFVPQVITSNCRYDKFRFIEAQTDDLTLVPPRVNFPYLGQYYYSIYEQVTSGNTDPALAYNKLESGRAVVIVGNDDINECLFEPYISNDENFANVIYVSDDEGECINPTPSVTPTNTVTPTITPTVTITPSITPTITPTTSCQVTTQYMNSEVVGGNRIRFTLWNDAGYTSQASSLCDYILSGTMLGSSGTTYTDARTFPVATHQFQENFSSVLLPGETIIYHTILSVNTSACTCPVVVNFTYVPPTPTPTITPTQTPTQTPTVTPTPSSTPLPMVNPSNLNATWWLDFTVSSAQTISSTTLVNSIDQITNSISWTGDSNGPIYIPSGFGGINSGMTFTYITPLINPPNSYSGTVNDYTWFAYINYPGTQQGAIIIEALRSTGLFWFNFTNPNTPTPDNWRANTFLSNGATASVNYEISGGSGWHSVAMRTTPSAGIDLELWVDGVVVGTSSVVLGIPVGVTNPRWGLMYNGGQSYNTEQFFFRRTLNNTEMTQMFNYLSNKY